MPSTVRGWLKYASYTLGSQAQTFSPAPFYTGQTDPRNRDSRETALSVKLAAERASHAVCGNGIGFELLTLYYIHGYSWHSFSEPERRLIAKTARAVAVALQEAGFIEKKVREGRDEEIVDPGRF